MSTSWIPLMNEALRDLASQQQQKIAPGSWCIMTEKPQVARFIGHSRLNAPCYHANAILRDSFSQTCDEHSFILPSEVPNQSLESYSIHLDEITGIFHVASRWRYLSLRGILGVKWSASSARSIYAAEFSNGNMTAIRKAGQANRRSHVHYNDTAESMRMMNLVDDSSFIQQKPFKVSDNRQADETVAHSQFQKATASRQHRSDSRLENGTSLELESSKGDVSCLASIDSSILKLGPVAPHGNINWSFDSFVFNEAFSNALRIMLTKSVSNEGDAPSKSLKLASHSINSNFDSKASTAASRGSSSTFSSSESDIGLEGLPSTPSSSTFSDHSCENSEVATQKTEVEPVTSVVIPKSGAPIDRAVIKNLPEFTIKLENVSRCCDALDMIRRSCTTRSCETEQDHLLPHLDLAPPSLRKNSAHELEAKHSFWSMKYEKFEISIDDASGELYLPSSSMTLAPCFTKANGDISAKKTSQGQSELRSLLQEDSDISHANVRNDGMPQESSEIEQVPAQVTLEPDHHDSASQSILRFEDIDLDKIFGDEDEYEVVSHGGANVAVDQAAVQLSAQTSDEALQSLDLRPRLINETIGLLEEVNTDYCRIWTQANPGVYYDCAIYDATIEQQAVQRFESKAGPMPAETRQVVNAFINAFLKIWREGHPKKPGKRWITGEDEPLVSTIAVKMVEWRQMVFNSSHIRDTVILRPGSRVWEESPSSLDWILRNFGAERRCHEHRSSSVDETEIAEQETGQAVVHHLNFNGWPVYERSYTPPEVSFWAAATTHGKFLLGKDLPCFHYARVITSQAFRWVDPTKYLGDDINALWQKEGSAMRDAATSDVRVVYQAIGTWNRDHFTAEDTIPEVAPADQNYEFAANGNYNLLQLPHLFNVQAEEHLMYNLNEGRSSEFHHSTSLEYDKDRPCLLKYELGAELVKKAALLERQLEKEKSPYKSVDVLETLAEELPSTDEDPSINDDEDASEAETDIQGSVDPDHEPVDLVNRSEEPQSTFNNGEASQTLENGTSEVDDEWDSGEDMEEEEQTPEEPREDTYDDEQSLTESSTGFQSESTSEPSVSDLQISADGNVSPGTPNSPAGSEGTTGESMIRDSMAFLDRLIANPLNRPPGLDNLGVDDEGSFVESEKESFDGDNAITDQTSIWPPTPDPAEHPKAEMLARFTEDPELMVFDGLEENGSEDAGTTGPAIPGVGAETQSSDLLDEVGPGALQDGRYISPSKIIQSRMGDVRTPPQSPSKDDDHGSWDLKNDGTFKSPEQPKSDSASESESESSDEVEWENVFQRPEQGTDVGNTRAVFSGRSWEDDDVFVSGNELGSNQMPQGSPEPEDAGQIIDIGSSSSEDLAAPNSLLVRRRYSITLSPIREETSDTDSPPAHRNIVYRPSQVIASPHQMPSPPTAIANSEIRRAEWREAHLAEYAERPQQRSGMEVVLWKGKTQNRISLLHSLMARPSSPALILGNPGTGIMRRVFDCSLTR